MEEFEDIVALLLAPGADIEAKTDTVSAVERRASMLFSFTTILSTSQHQRFTSLYLAAMYGRMAVVKQLIAQQANIDAISNHHMHMPNITTSSGT